MKQTIKMVFFYAALINYNIFITLINEIIGYLLLSCIQSQEEEQKEGQAISCSNNTLTLPVSGLWLPLLCLPRSYGGRLCFAGGGHATEQRSVTALVNDV